LIGSKDKDLTRWLKDTLAQQRKREKDLEAALRELARSRAKRS